VVLLIAVELFHLLSSSLHKTLILYCSHWNTWCGIYNLDRSYFVI